MHYTTLKNRGLIRIEGKDARPFLQGLISNDISLLDSQGCVYACLLNAQGKFLHDFFITEKDGAILMDCEGGARAVDLFKRLSMYKLRVDIRMEYQEKISVFAILPTPLTSPLPLMGGGRWGEGYPDPRHTHLGFRSFTKPALPEQSFEVWDRHRIALTVPDGSRDIIPEKSTLLESNIDKLNGVSFEKGCYVGQELTARMHYRGLAKKHLYTVNPYLLSSSAKAEDPVPDSPVKPGDDLYKDGQLIGEMRSRCGDIGIALLKDEFAEALNLKQI